MKVQNKIQENNGAFLVNNFPETYDFMVAKYKDCKEGRITPLDLTEEEQKEINTLSILENLGYPMTETGTYFYKNVIIRAMDELQQIKTEQDYVDLMSTMANNYSQFYFDIARNEYDIGLTTFHSCIHMVNQHKNNHQANEKLQKKIGLTDFVVDYKGEALLIANYMITRESKKENPQVKKMIRKSYGELV